MTDEDIVMFRSFCILLPLLALGCLHKNALDSERHQACESTIEAPTNGRVHAALDEEVQEISWDGVPVEKALRELSRIAGVPIKPDWERISELGIEKGAEVSLRVRNVHLRKVLELILHENGDDLDFVVADGAIIISTSEEIARLMKRKRVTDSE